MTRMVGVVSGVLLALLVGCATVEEGATGPPPPPVEGIAVPEDAQRARVVAVIDGDTIDVEIGGHQERLRYIGVNTPERDQPFYREATDANSALVEGREVLLERDVSDRDRFGRLLRYVYVDERQVNAELVRQGVAQPFTLPPDVRYQELFLALHREAQREGRGLWAGLPPLEEGVVITRLDDRAEVVEIANQGAEPQSLDGWELLSERGRQSCRLAGSLAPGERLEIWARAEDQSRGGYNCGFDENIWSSRDPDPAVLLDAAGREIDRFESDP